MKMPDSQAPSRKVQREEIVAAIDEICEKRAVPAVRISDIEELEHIEVGRQAISDNLEDLKEMGRVNLLEYGQKGVWWVPEDIESSADVESGVIDWDSIDPTDIPHDVLAELPQFQDQTYWKRTADNWRTAAGGGSFVFALSLFTIFVNQNTPIELGSTTSDLLAVVLVGSVGVAVISLGIVQLAGIGQWLENKGVNDRVRNAFRGVKYGAVRWVQQRLPELEG